jgi:hypothetical protein
VSDPARSLSPRCPRCDSEDLKAVATYDEDDAPTGVVAVICARCGFHLEDAPADAVAPRELAGTNR